MRMSEFLGKPASKLVEAEPFKSWPVERWVDDDSDPPLVGYEFQDCGLQLNCDREHETVRSVFLETDKHEQFVLSEIPFTENRQQLMKRLGMPSKSGERTSHPILGNFGPWDRFQATNYTIHVQFELESDTIAKITLMRNDATP